MGIEAILVDLLKLLFGNLGVLGTMLTVLVAYMAWLLNTERGKHDETRRLVMETQERRLEMYAANVRVLSELKTLLDMAMRRNGNDSKS